MFHTPQLLTINPLAIRGLQLYLNQKTATVSSWKDQSTNAFDFAQATATKQPTISGNAVRYDGVDDFQRHAAAQPFNDNSGIVFFSGYSDNAATNYVLCQDSSVSGADYCNFISLSTGEIGIQINNGTTHDLIKSTSTILNGAYYYGYIKSVGTGSPYEISLNGTVETNVVFIGADNGKWFSAVTSNGITTGALIRTSPSEIYSKAKINKVIYSNAALTSQEIADINNFMSNPLN